MLLAPERDLSGIEFWDKLYDAKDRNREIYASVVGVVQKERIQDGQNENREPAWELEFDGGYNVRGRVPFSETGLQTEKMMNYFVGKEVKVVIKGINKKNNL